MFETGLGWMGVLASSRGLTRTTLPQPSPDICFSLLAPSEVHVAHSPEHFARLRERLSLYFEGQHVSFRDEPLDVGDASPFLRRAWRACLSIPFGETRTYKWLAAQAGRPNAPRAAGQSMARNRLPIIVPCHRVIASDGGLRGFGRGTSQLRIKRWLLEIESGLGESARA